MAAREPAGRSVFDGGEVWDAVVVGAGPAGAVAALHLAAAGRRVLLLDRREFPREKTCGDGLLPDAVRALERAGVWDEVRARAFRSDTARFFSPARIEVSIPGEFYTLERRLLDALLVAAAERRGAVRRVAHVERLRAHADGVELEVRGGPPVGAWVVIVATGADVSLLEPLGMVRRAAPSAVAVRRYLRSDAQLDELVFSFDRASLPGYGWIFPLGGGLYNLGCGIFGRRARAAVNPRALFDRFLQDFPLARELVGRGEFTGPLRGARLRCGLHGVSPLGAERVLVAGETLGATFPFSGEGIGKAMETGELAAAAVERALRAGETTALAAYPAAVERLRPRYRGYEVAERWLAHRWLADLLARQARRSARLRGAVAGIVAEEVDPREVFSLRALLRSLRG